MSQDETKTTAQRNRDKVKNGLSSLQSRAIEAETTALDAVQANPVAAMAAAAAAGAVLAGMLPTSARERDALRPIARKARTAASKAVSNARSSGLAHLTESGLTKAAITSGVTGLVGAILNASQSSMAAAKDNADHAAGTQAQQPSAVV